MASSIGWRNRWPSWPIITPITWVDSARFTDAWPVRRSSLYRTADEAHNADGKHVAYLTPGRSAGRLRQLDPDLYDRLARIVSTGQRSTAALAVRMPRQEGQVRCRCMRASGLLPIPPSPATLLAG